MNGLDFMPHLGYQSVALLLDWLGSWMPAVPELASHRTGADV